MPDLHVRLRFASYQLPLVILLQTSDVPPTCLYNYYESLGRHLQFLFFKILKFHGDHTGISVWGVLELLCKVSGWPFNPGGGLVFKLSDS